nr:MAG TPA_asm: tail tube protein [Caudoviricetes sp.]
MKKSKKIYEYRGVSDAVYAEVLKDDSENFTVGEVKPFVGVSEIGKTTESSNEPHYYDNIPAIIICSTGSDEISITGSAFPMDTLAEITGQYYDEATGMMVECERTQKYFAFGYRTKRTDGTEVLVWRLKGSFSIPDATHVTEDDGTDANGQEITYTGISTTHKFTKTGKTAKAVNVDMGLDLVDGSTFFDTVQTPDSVKAKTV